MKNIKVYLLIFLCLMLVGCATTSTYSTLQKRQIETKEFDADYKTVFSAVKTILQDNNYVINNSDYDGGLITGVGATKQSYMPFVGIFHVSNVVSISITDLGNDRTSVRMNIMKRTSSNRGVNDEAVIKPEMMQGIYADVHKEILIRQNLAQ